MRTLLPCCLFLFSTLALGAERVEFNRDVRPILADTCFQCHGPDAKNRKGELRLDTVEGKTAVKELVRRIETTDKDEVMPPPKSPRQLTAAQKTTLKRWVEQGAEWQAHWAYIAPKRPELPTVKDAAWSKNPIDRFVLAKLEAHGLQPSPEAPKHTLIRRLSLDLTGLPPTPAEVEAFTKDISANAYAKLVERLLQSERFGERLAYDWLDGARYADSNGYQQDRTRTMWPWRDWVVDAFNKNMPFDQFTIEQIAGDKLPEAKLSQKIATGYHRNHMLNGEGGRVAEESRIDYVVDRVDTTAQVWLGLTLGCARCHDHKFDPFSAKDYYRLFAYFNNVAESGSVDRGGNANPVLRVPSTEQQRRLDEATKTIRELEPQLKKSAPKANANDVQRSTLAALVRNPLSFLRVPEEALKPSAERIALGKKLAAANKTLDDTNKAIPEVMVMEDRPQPRETHILVRGTWDQKGEKVTPGVPELLGKLPKDATTDRLALAKWLVANDNPLTARVIVNRYWQLLFGTGLVKTTEDFGVQGEQPPHQELLDWLAIEFRDSGWNLKKLLTLMVTSKTYQQSSKLSPELKERDPENRLFARGARFRLSSHTIRDQALYVSGLYVEKLGGPPVKPYQPPNIWEEMSFNQIRYQQDHGEALYRRSLYTFWRRTVGPTNLFDTAARQVCVLKQARTNTPLHALITLNDVTFAETQRVLAERMMKEGGGTPGERITFAYQLATSRKPTERELPILVAAFERLHKQYSNDKASAEKVVSAGEKPRDPKLNVSEMAAYAGVASVILNLDEVLTRE
jgi:hypothetical protein